MKPTQFRFIFLALIFQVIGLSSFAETTALINYQGKLVQGKKPVTDHVSMTFRIYTDMTAGTCIYEEPMTVQVVDGYYSVLLGKNPVVGDIEQAASEDETYLEVSVNGNPLRPREKFTPPPFAKKSTEHWRTLTAGLSDGYGGALTALVLDFPVTYSGTQSIAFPPTTEKKTVVSAKYRLSGKEVRTFNSDAPHPCYLNLEIASGTGGVSRILLSEPVDLVPVEGNKWLQLSLSTNLSNRVLQADDKIVVSVQNGIPENYDNGLPFGGYEGDWNSWVHGTFTFDVEVR